MDGLFELGVCDGCIGDEGEVAGDGGSSDEFGEGFDVVEIRDEGFEVEFECVERELEARRFEDFGIDLADNADGLVVEFDGGGGAWGEAIEIDVLESGSGSVALVE